MNGFSVFDNVGATALGVLQAIAPILIILVVFQLLFLKLPRSYVYSLLKGVAISGVGLFLFLQGVQAGFLPYGRYIGQALGELSFKWISIPFGFVLGFFTTWGEPAVRILCDQVEEASAGSIRKTIVLFTICIGVAIFVAIGMARVVYTIPLTYILIPGYSLAIIMLWFTQREFLAFAFDAGGVATGPIANTFLLALGLGLSSVNGGHSPIVFGLGLISLIALAPIMSVMALGIIYRIKTAVGGRKNG